MWPTVTAEQIAGALDYYARHPRRVDEDIKRHAQAALAASSRSVTSTRIPLFTDEHIDARLAPALSRRGFDALSCQEAGRANQRVSDEDQLAFAASQGRAILTFNTVDFIALDIAWKQAGRRHAGIIVSAEIRSLTDLIHRVGHHLSTVSPDQQDDTLLWLSTRLS